MEYVIIGVIVLLAAFWIITPLLRPAAPSGAGLSLPALDLQREELHAQRDTLLYSLKDLEFDKSMGKINDDEYASLRADVVAQTSEVLDRLERLEGRMGSLSAEGPAGTLAGSTQEAALELEVLVARRRRANAAAS